MFFLRFGGGGGGGGERNGGFLSMRMQVIMYSLFSRLGSAPVIGVKGRVQVLE